MRCYVVAHRWDEKKDVGVYTFECRVCGHRWDEEQWSYHRHTLSGRKTYIKRAGKRIPCPPRSLFEKFARYWSDGVVIECPAYTREKRRKP